MKNLYLMFLLIISGCLHAQSNLENANWIFGNLAWLDFNNNSLTSHPTPSYGTSVTSFTPSANYSTSEGCASISDEDGNLLFFTDGRRVYRIVNGSVEIIDYNSGTNLLLGNLSSAQNTIIVPRPNWEGRYYLISIIGFTSGTTRGLYWSELDINTNQFISINNPMGDGVNIFDATFNNTSESITSCVAANGVDMWIIVHMKNNNFSRVMSYLVSPSGIATIPSSIFNMPLPDPWESFAIKTSPDTQKLALGRRFSNPLIGTFNNLTGAILIDTNPVGNNTIGSNNHVYSVEFSPDSQILYFARYFNSSPPNTITGIFAIDLSNNTQESQVFSLAINDNRLSTVQRALNNKLYVANSSQSTIFEITNPNSFGSWNVASITLDTGQISRMGLPQWIWKTCKNTLTLSSPTNNVNGTNSTRERSDWIRASNFISSSANTRTIYHAGNFVELLTGFEAVNGAQFAAYIEGCSNSYVYRDQNSSDIIGSNPKPEIKKKSNSFAIVPNPSSSIIDVVLNNFSSGKLQIVSLDGRKVFETSIENSDKIQVDVSNYNNGIYIVTVTDVSGQQFSQKLIKN